MKMKVLSILVVSILVLAGFVMVWNFGTENIKVRAAALYVGGVGPGNWTKIQDAIDNATDGDTIYVYNGTYYENVIVNKSVSIIGNGTENCTIDGSGSGDVVNISVDWVNLTGFAIMNSGTSTNDSGIKLNNVQNSRIEFNNCSNNKNGIFLNNSNNNIFDDNMVTNSGGDGLYVNSSDGNMFTNTTILNSTNKDIFSANTDLILINCTFNNSKLEVAGGGTITVQYYHTLYIYDWATVWEDAGGVADADFWTTANGSAVHIYEGITNASGYANWINLTAYIYNGTFNYSMQNMTFHATKAGYSEGINITNATAANFLIPIFMIDPFEPKLYDVSMIPDENITKTNPTLIKAKIEDDNLLSVGMMFMHNSGQSATEEYYDIIAFIFENDPRITLPAGPG
ncbi:MAG: right-handed parallel beta-helix repeat-containing protein, partial [Thermoplasmata archaeon]|nr:right-handed parallel beta-helix repeat-containing protein [Thermoplasmata archaeon]